jgi:hypothetical protein
MILKRRPLARKEYRPPDRSQKILRQRDYRPFAPLRREPPAEKVKAKVSKLDTMPPDPDTVLLAAIDRLESKAAELEAAGSRMRSLLTAAIDATPESAVTDLEYGRAGFLQKGVGEFMFACGAAEKTCCGYRPYRGSGHAVLACESDLRYVRAYKGQDGRTFPRGLCMLRGCQCALSGPRNEVNARN